MDFENHSSRRNNQHSSETSQKFEHDWNLFWNVLQFSDEIIFEDYEKLIQLLTATDYKTDHDTVNMMKKIPIEIDCSEKYMTEQPVPPPKLPETTIHLQLF